MTDWFAHVSTDVFVNDKMFYVWCVSLCLCLYYGNAVASLDGASIFQTSDVCVCLLMLLYLSTEPTCHRWTPLPSSSLSSSVWFLDLHFPPAWMSSFPLSWRERNKNTFTLLLSAEVASKMWTKTLQIWCCWRTFLSLLFFFSSHFLDKGRRW